MLKIVTGGYGIRPYNMLVIRIGPLPSGLREVTICTQPTHEMSPDTNGRVKTLPYDHVSLPSGTQRSIEYRPACARIARRGIPARYRAVPKGLSNTDQLAHALSPGTAGRHLYENNCMIYQFSYAFHTIIDKRHKIPLGGIWFSCVFVDKTSIDFKGQNE